MHVPDRKGRHKRRKKCLNDDDEMTNKSRSSLVVDETTKISSACALSREKNACDSSAPPPVEPDVEKKSDEEMTSSRGQRQKSKETISKEKFISRIKSMKPIWKNKHGEFKKIATTSTGNCFFSALTRGGLFNSEDEARSEVVRLVKLDEFLFYQIYEWHKGQATLDGFRVHLDELAKDKTWASDVDIFITAVALMVDIISINEFDNSICRPLMNQGLIKRVPGVENVLNNCEDPEIIVLGNVDISGKKQRPNHFILLEAVTCNFELFTKPLMMTRKTECIQVGKQAHVYVDVGDEDLDVLCGDSSRVEISDIGRKGEIKLKAEDDCEVSITKSEGESQGKSLQVYMGKNASISVVRKRNVQQVVTNADRLTVVKWMIEQEALGVTKIPSKAVKQFPSFFRQKSENSNVKKASRWFDKRQEILKLKKVHSITSTFHGGGRRKCALKTLGGRGRRRAPWVEWLHVELLQEFERLSSCGVKFSNDLLRLLAMSILEESEHEVFNTNYIDPLDKSQTNIGSKITYGWVSLFMERFDIVIRKQAGKLMVSDEKQLSIEKNVAYHLGQIKRDFDNGILDENMVENSDETHFVVNMDNGRTLAMKGSDKVKYADVVGGGDGMTLMVRVTGGVDAKIYASLMIFSNKDRNYPIRGLPDNVPGVCYRTGPKGWMDQKVFVEWLEEERANPPDKYGRKKVIFMDNCSGHNETPQSIAALSKLKAEIRKLPSNATDLCQPADSFIISKIKDVWTREWERTKIELIKNGAWADEVRSDGKWSGKLNNPGKRYFLELAAKAVNEVNAQRDKSGMSYARKAMIKCGLSKDAVTGQWQESQLFGHLQAIINKHREYFDGRIPE